MSVLSYILFYLNHLACYFLKNLKVAHMYGGWTSPGNTFVLCLSWKF